MAQKVENNDYTKAQAYFLNIFDEEEQKQNKCQKQLTQAMIKIKAQIMGKNDINGVVIQKNEETRTMVICAKVGKEYKKWEQLPSFLKEMENKPSFSNENIKDCYFIVNEETKNTLIINGKDVLFIVKYDPIEVKSLQKATNHIGGTNYNEFSNLTKPQSYFIPQSQNNESKEENKSLNSKIKKVAIEMRGQIMGLKGVIGVNTKRFKSVNSLVIVARVGKDFNGWTQNDIPKFIKPMDNPPKINDQNINCKGFYNIFDPQSNQPVKIDQKDVLLFTICQNNSIAALKSPENKIVSNKIHNYEKKGQQNK